MQNIIKSDFNKVYSVLKNWIWNRDGKGIWIKVGMLIS